MQRLMDIADEMVSETRGRRTLPICVVAIAKATGVLIDFCCNAITSRAPRLYVLLCILKEEIDELPRRRRPITRCGTPYPAASMPQSSRFRHLHRWRPQNLRDM